MECRGSDVESLEATELRLGLPGTDNPVARRTKRATRESDDSTLKNGCTVDEELGRGTTPPAKTQVVGWPPVRSFRKNNLRSAAKKPEAAESSPGLFVKVSMDGAPYLRKIDLNVYKGYKQLRHALDAMFKCFSTGENGSEFAIAYEDKDGDWMLAGDVPWEMFTCSCKRLRIMKGSEAKGLAPSL